MAASPSASLPFINTFSKTFTSLFLDGYDAVGTDTIAAAARDAGRHIRHRDGRLAAAVQFFAVECQYLFRTVGNAQAAAFAPVRENG